MYTRFYGLHHLCGGKMQGGEGSKSMLYYVLGSPPHLWGRGGARGVRGSKGKVCYTVLRSPPHLWGKGQGERGGARG